MKADQKGLKPFIRPVLSMYIAMPAVLKWLVLLGFGALGGLIQAPTSAWWLMFFTFPALALALDTIHVGTVEPQLKQTQKRTRHLIISAVKWLKARGVITAFFTVQAFGAGYFLSSSAWIRYSFDFFPALPPGLGWLAIVALSFVLGCFWGLAGLVSQAFWPAHPLRILMLVSCLTLFDALRTVWPLGGFALNLPAYAWLGIGVLEQALSLIGPYGLNAITFFLSFLPVILFKPWRFICSLWLFVAVVMITGLIIFGLWRLENATDATFNVALKLVQPNIDQRDKMNPDFAFINVKSYDELARTTGWPNDANADTRLVIYPETALHFSYEQFAPLMPRPLPDLADADILISGSFRAVKPERFLVKSNRFNDQEARQSKDLNSPLSSSIKNEKARPQTPLTFTRYYNAVYAFWPQAAKASRHRFEHLYDKVKVVPFGEYTPAAETLSEWGFRFAENMIGLSAGDAMRVKKLEGIPPFLPLICFDALFPTMINEAVGTSASWLLVLTNDGWFLGSDGPAQHLAQTRARAIELGLPLVRSTPNGLSAVIDPFGRITASLGPDERGVVQARLPAPLSPTFYRKFGESLWLGLIGLILGVGIWVRLKNFHIR